MQSLSNHPYFHNLSLQIDQTGPVAFNPKLKGKVAVILGVGDSVEQKIIDLFIASGARVIAGGIEKEIGLKFEAQYPGKFKFSAFDLTSGEDIKTFIGQACACFARIDILVNNFGSTSYLEEVKHAHAVGGSATMRFLISPAALAVHTILPVMIRQGAGSIINLAPASGLKMHHVLLLTRLFAAQVSTHRIRINVVRSACASGDNSVGTDFESFSDSRLKVQTAFAKRIPTPLELIKAAEDTASACLYLASDESRHITGSSLASLNPMMTHMDWDLEAYRMAGKAFFQQARL